MLLYYLLFQIRNVNSGPHVFGRRGLSSSSYSNNFDQEINDFRLKITGDNLLMLFFNTFSFFIISIFLTSLCSINTRRHSDDDSYSDQTPVGCCAATGGRYSRFGSSWKKSKESSGHSISGSFFLRSNSRSSIRFPLSGKTSNSLSNEYDTGIRRSMLGSNDSSLLTTRGKKEHGMNKGRKAASAPSKGDRKDGKNKNNSTSNMSNSHDRKDGKNKNNSTSNMSYSHDRKDGKNKNISTSNMSNSHDRKDVKNKNNSTSNMSNSHDRKDVKNKNNSTSNMSSSNDKKDGNHRSNSVSNVSSNDDRNVGRHDSHLVPKAPNNNGRRIGKYDSHFVSNMPNNNDKRIGKYGSHFVSNMPNNSGKRIGKYGSHFVSNMHDNNGKRIEPNNGRRVARMPNNNDGNVEMNNGRKVSIMPNINNDRKVEMNDGRRVSIMPNNNRGGGRNDGHGVINMPIGQIDASKRNYVFSSVTNKDRINRTIDSTEVTLTSIGLGSESEPNIAGGVASISNMNKGSNRGNDMSTPFINNDRINRIIDSTEVTLTSIGIGSEIGNNDDYELINTYTEDYEQTYGGKWNEISGSIANNDRINRAIDNTEITLTSIGLVSEDGKNAGREISSITNNNNDRKFEVNKGREMSNIPNNNDKKVEANKGHETSNIPNNNDNNNNDKKVEVNKGRETSNTPNNNKENGKDDGLDTAKKSRNNDIGDMAVGNAEASAVSVSLDSGFAETTCTTTTIDTESIVSQSTDVMRTSVENKKDSNTLKNAEVKKKSDANTKSGIESKENDVINKPIKDRRRRASRANFDPLTDKSPEFVSDMGGPSHREQSIAAAQAKGNVHVDNTRENKSQPSHNVGNPAAAAADPSIFPPPNTHVRGRFVSGSSNVAPSTNRSPRTDDNRSTSVHPISAPGSVNAKKSNNDKEGHRGIRSGVKRGFTSFDERDFSARAKSVSNPNYSGKYQNRARSPRAPVSARKNEQHNARNDGSGRNRTTDRKSSAKPSASSRAPHVSRFRNSPPKLRHKAH